MDSSLELLIEWRQERAVRVARIFGYIGLVLAGLGTVFDVIWNNYLLVPTDLLLVFGCAVSLYLAKQTPPRLDFWKPIYFSYFISSLPFYWQTGGLHSPFFGIGIALLYCIGEVLDARGRSRAHLFFALAHVPAFYFAGYLYPPEVPPSLPTGFVALVTAINLGGVFVCLRALLRTETELSRQFSERQLRLAAETHAKLKAEKANEAKMQFLANMSHEIRTPLNSVLGYAELMHDSTSFEEVKQYSERIKVNGDQLLRLVNDILDLSKFEAGRVPVHQTMVNVRDVINNTILSFVPNVEKKNLKISSDVADNVPQEIFIDRQRLMQILVNLINNAIKFTDKGSVDIRAFVADKTFVLVVQDTGIGIAQEQQKDLFQNFSQIDSSLTRRHGGTGLGLALSRRISEAMGGSLDLDWSIPDQGSRFVFRLPLECRIK